MRAEDEVRAYVASWDRVDHPDGRSTYRPSPGAVSRSNPEITFWPDGRITEAWS